ncbi:MAG TPA: aldehyde dehydrogenase family protein [Verrucomicrobiae bacterium]|jgi:betaine-aldehyde dehydrogenase|nr:aldehyde dehydrogenase family protein [Verrucomicrobiae bacterium]
MRFPTQLILHGQTRPGSEGRTIPIINPATEKTLCEVAAASRRDVDTAAQCAQRCFEQTWRDLAPGRRASILFDIAAAIRRHAEELAQLEMVNIGKPIADARDEIALGARTFEYYAGAISKFCGQTIPVARGGLDFTLRQPMGVAAAIVPWNFPFPIACWKVAPALAAGNCVILKPARLSPLTALRLGELALAAGLPDDALQVLAGPGEEMGEALARHPLVRKIGFTGSTAVGAQIMRAAADDVKRVSLELGGKSPNIIFADADWQQAAQAAPMSVFANTGQDCCARSRVFVERKIFGKFTDAFLKATDALVIGNPAHAKTQIGPMVSQQQRAVVEGYVESAREAGRTLHGGGRIGKKGYYLRPTVITDCSTTDKVWREEIFGPVACLRPFTNEDEMLAEVNASPYGLSGSIWTNDLKRALRVAQRVESGVLSINTNSSVHVEAPFGGCKQSGLGRDLGMAALEAYTEVKNIYIGG